jgi:hypothetical protein
MRDAEHVRDLGFRRPIDAPDLRRVDGAAEKHAHFEVGFLRPHEEIAGLAGEHDRVMRGVDPLFAECRGGLAEPLPRVEQILGKVARQRGFGRRPAVVRCARLNPLLAVIALVSGHDHCWFGLAGDPTSRSSLAGP